MMVKYFSSVQTAISNDKMPEINAMYGTEISHMEISRKEVQNKPETLKVNLA